VRNHYRRTPLLLAGLALSSTALVVAAPPASAALIEGHVTATGDVDASDACALDGSTTSQTEYFSNRTGAHTAEAEGEYSATDPDTAAVGASGHSDAETTAYGTVQNRAFKRVDFESTQVVVMKNDTDVDCGMEIFALAEADATLRVRERGRVKIRWNSSVGDLELVRLTGPAGTIVNRNPAPGSGEVVVRVRPGTYQLSSRFRTTARESDVAETQSRTVVGYFTSSATYLS